MYKKKCAARAKLIFLLIRPIVVFSRAWGGDLIVFVGPGVGHLTDLVLPGEGIFESFLARRRDI